MVVLLVDLMFKISQFNLVGIINDVFERIKGKQ